MHVDVDVYVVGNVVVAVDMVMYGMGSMNVYVGMYDILRCVCVYEW